jgi:DNA-binding GntR family transcriptional regulator
MTRETLADAITQRRAQSLAGLVRDEIERLILAGALPAGERLNELALAGRFGVSRGPVREAARLLERDGLVASVAGQGAFVRRISVEEASELYDLRAVVVGHACGAAAGRFAPEGLAELEGLVAAMDAAAEAGEAARYYELNLAFHDRLMALTARPRAAALYAGLVKETHLFRRRSLVEPEAMRESNAEHRAIVTALAQGDAAAAREAAERHHMNGKRRWLRTLE